MNVTKKILNSNFLFKLIKQFIFDLIINFQYKLIRYFHGKEQIGQINKAARKVGFSCLPDEAFNIYSIARAQSKLRGDMAEVGVYKGFTASLISMAKGNRRLYLFDTFEGLPTVDNKEEYFKKGQFPSNYIKVKKYLSKYKNVWINKGLFPKTAKPISKRNFSFVHLDVDIYKSTLDCLNFFYPHMIKGGIIISHDYSCAKGVKRAFINFFKNKTEDIIELSTTQCLVIKQ